MRTRSTRPPFNEAKATQAAARFLWRRGGRMSYLKLIKLLYFADREALLRWGRTITTDRFVSMDRGPVVSRTYELICEDLEPGIESYWRRFISPAADFEVSLIGNAPGDELSVAETRLIDEIFDRYGKRSRWELVDLAHQLPEWIDPEGSSIPIEIRDILRAENRDQADIDGVISEIEELAAIEGFRSR